MSLESRVKHLFDSPLGTRHSPLVSGGHEGTRTPNFLLVREAVYQLTYVPEIFSRRASTRYICPKEIFKKTRPFRRNERTKMLSNWGDEVKLHFMVARISPMSFSVVSGLMKQNRTAVSLCPPRPHFVGATRANPSL